MNAINLSQLNFIHDQTVQGYNCITQLQQQIYFSNNSSKKIEICKSNKLISLNDTFFC
jgi:hypothetical protein